MSAERPKNTLSYSNKSTRSRFIKKYLCICSQL